MTINSYLQYTAIVRNCSPCVIQNSFYTVCTSAKTGTIEQLTVLVSFDCDDQLIARRP